MPVQVLGITDATAISAGNFHSCALRQDGTISCWGRNRSGQLGNGQSGGNADSPVQVFGITDATAIASSGTHSCALHQGGTISCWGSNGDGQLGNGTDHSSSVPVQVTGIADATAIGMTSYFSCALHQTGTISCWGENGSGQLGNGQSGRNARSLVPVQVIGITDATAIAAGGSQGSSIGHSCALHRNGTISCWGTNYDGRLGIGQSDRGERLVPAQVLSITDATAIAAGGGNANGYSCALHRDGTISCWGSNGYGQLGNGTRSNFVIPVQVVGITDATAITTGDEHTCALHQNGTISCWGRNRSGQLGDGQSGDSANSSVPVLVTGIGR